MKSKNIETTCRVCGSLERTSTHFGSTCCMACASFFRRTVSFGIRFLCKADNNCQLSESDIKFICRSCRYDNCIKAGMRRDLVQQKRDDSRVPKYVLESWKIGIREVVRGYTTSSYTESTSSSSCRLSSASPTTTRSSTPILDLSESSETCSEASSELNRILNTTHDELLQYYVKQVQEAALNRRFDLPEDAFQQFLISKTLNDKLALDICQTCPGTDLLEKPDLEVLFRYCSFASLWMDSAWYSVNSKLDYNQKRASKPSETSPLQSFIDLFQSTITSELSRTQLDIVEYAALKSFCIWKLGLLDSTLTLKIVAQEQYIGVTMALSKYYQSTKGMEDFEIATRLADITLMLGSIFNIYQSMLHLYSQLSIPLSIDNVSNCR